MQIYTVLHLQGVLYFSLFIYGQRIAEDIDVMYGCVVSQLYLYHPQSSSV